MMPDMFVKSVFPCGNVLARWANWSLIALLPPEEEPEDEPALDNKERRMPRLLQQTTREVMMIAAKQMTPTPIKSPSHHSYKKEAFEIKLIC